ncbi:MAG: hypothetical protein ACREGC_03455, partial [Minisyncoccia bacterium]
MNQFADALELAHWHAGHITKAGQSRPTLESFRGVLDGTHEIRLIEHAIDLGGTAQLPFIGAILESHRGSGIVKVERRWDGIYLQGRKLGLFLSKEQKDGNRIEGYKLREELEKRGNNLSANLLDFFVRYPELWPE